MTLAILSDIHGNLPALEAVVADAEAQGCSAFVNLGDALSGPLWPAETADYLMAKHWPTISGNHERQLVTQKSENMGASDAYALSRLSARHMAWASALPATLDLGDGVFLCHGTPGSDLDYLLEDVGPEGVRAATPAEIADRIGNYTYPLIFCGHSHIPRRVELGDGRAVANPGSVGLPAYSSDWPVDHVMETGTAQARYAILERGEIRLRAIDYDHAAAAVQADRNGRPDWAYPLRHGRMTAAEL